MARRVQYDFSGGYISNDARGRRDIASYHRGLATCRNFTTRPSGSLQNREGGEVVGWEAHKYVGPLIKILDVTTAPTIFTVASHTFEVNDQVVVTMLDGSPNVTGATYAIASVPGAGLFTLKNLQDGSTVVASGTSTFGWVQKLDATGPVRCVNFNVRQDSGYALYWGNGWMMPVRLGGHELDQRGEFSDATPLTITSMTKTKPIEVAFSTVPKSFAPGMEIVVGEIDDASGTNNWADKLSGNRYQISFMAPDVAASAIATIAMSFDAFGLPAVDIAMAAPHGLTGSVWGYIEGVGGDLGGFVNEKWWWLEVGVGTALELPTIFEFSGLDDRFPGSRTPDDDVLTWGVGTPATGTIRFSPENAFILNDTDATGYTGVYPAGTPALAYTVERIWTPYSTDDLAGLSFDQDGDDLVVTSPNHVQRILTRIARLSPAAIDWQFIKEDFVPALAVPPTVSGDTASENDYRVAITAVETGSGDESPPRYFAMLTGTPVAKTLTVTKPILDFGQEVFEYNLYSTTDIDKKILGFNVSMQGNTIDIDFSAVDEIDFASRPPEHPNPFETRGAGFDISAISGVGTALLVPTVTLSTAIGFFSANRRVFIEDTVGSETLNNRTLLASAQYSTTPPVIGTGGVTVALIYEQENSIGGTGWSAGGVLYLLEQTIFPNAVGHFGQRRFYAEGDTIYACRLGVPGSFEQSVPPRDTDAFTFRIAGSNSDIRHIIGTKHMLVFTGGGIFVVSADDNGAEIPPTGIRIANDFSGVMSNVKPLQIGKRVIFYAETGPVMRDISYDGLTTQYGGSSLSLLVADLLEGHTVVDMAYTSEPEPVIWSVRGDGVMLGTTYDGDNNIRGWHIHDTPYGQWEYACSVREPMEDVRYDSVDRTLPLHQRRRYFERYRSRSMLGDIRKSHCVDAGVRYESPFEEGAPLALDPLSMTRSSASPVTFTVGDDVDIVHWMRKEGKRVPGPHHKKRYEIKSTTATLLEFRAVGAGADIDGTDVLDFPVLEFGVYLAENTIKRGMQHLANETTLDVLANGLYYANLTVTGDGDLVLPGGVKASQFSIGWRYDADFGTLPIEGLDPAGESNIGKDIAVKRPVLLFYNSHKGSVGPDVDRIRELAQETDANFNDELQLFSEAHVADMQPARNEGTFFYRHSKPTPVTILATVLIHD